MSMSRRDVGHIADLAEYLGVVQGIRNDWVPGDPPERMADVESPWFRGQHDAAWGLGPKIYRPEFEGADENEIRHEFEAVGPQIIPGRVPATKWEWYFLMQHYGIPTRLLDWSENPLVALYFAVTEHKSNSDAAVWAVDPSWLNSQSSVLKNAGVEGALLHDWEESDSYLHDLEDAYAGDSVKAKYPAAIEPPAVDRRLVAQASRFVVFGTARDMTKLYPRTRRGRVRLARIRIRQLNIGSIHKELLNCGITLLTVFPDLEGLAKQIVQR